MHELTGYPFKKGRSSLAQPCIGSPPNQALRQPMCPQVHQQPHPVKSFRQRKCPRAAHLWTQLRYWTHLKALMLSLSFVTSSLGCSGGELDLHIDGSTNHRDSDYPYDSFFYTQEKSPLSDSFAKVDSISASTQTACFIFQGQCISSPENVGWILDDFDSSGSNKERCLDRALEQSMSCKNAFSTATVAYFFSDNQIAAGRGARSTNGSPIDGCLITQSTCTAVPATVGSFFDTFEEAGTKPERCIERALEYAVYCKNPISSRTVAEFYVNGIPTSGVVAASDGDAAINGCLITLAQCSAHPQPASSFLDNHENASTDQARCLKRALEYAVYCNNSFTITSTAEFFVNGVRQAVQVTRADNGKPFSGCLLTQNQCVKQPAVVGTFKDNFDNSDTDMIRCYRRAKEYSKWCENPKEVITWPEFYVAGERQ